MIKVLLILFLSFSVYADGRHDQRLVTGERVEIFCDPSSGSWVDNLPAYCLNNPYSPACKDINPQGIPCESVHEGRFTINGCTFCHGDSYECPDKPEPEPPEPEPPEPPKPCKRNCGDDDDHDDDDHDDDDHDDDEDEDENEDDDSNPPDPPEPPSPPPYNCYHHTNMACSVCHGANTKYTCQR